MCLTGAIEIIYGCSVVSTVYPLSFGTEIEFCDPRAFLDCTYYSREFRYIYAVYDLFLFFLNCFIHTLDIMITSIYLYRSDIVISLSLNKVLRL